MADTSVNPENVAKRNTGMAKKDASDIEGSVKKKAKAADKGDKGENTGSEVRRLISNLRDDGKSFAEIGEIIGRDADTVENIMSGNIENPPEDVLFALRQAGADNKA